MNEPREQGQNDAQTDDERLREALGELLERTTARKLREDSDARETPQAA